jgi:hypothetical protein
MLDEMRISRPAAPAEQDEEFTYSVADVAKRLRVSARWLGNQCRSGLVEHVFLARKRSFTEEQVQKLLDTYTVTPPKQTARDKSAKRIAARVQRDRTGLR